MATIERLQQRLGYLFGDRGILLQALTHKSFGHEFHGDKGVAHRDNERLEFLGDAILDLVISDILLEAYPNAAEGQLTKIRASVVNEKTLADVSRAIRLPECVRLGRGETLTGGNEKPSILSGTFEALIAAIYLDGGYQAVYPVVRHLFSPFFTDGTTTLAAHDHKTQLQEIMQARFRVTPTYILRGTTGPDHAKIFEVEVKVKDEVLGFATGFSKKEAEQNAARGALQSVARE